MKLLIAIFIMCFPISSYADEVLIAVAANFARPMEKITAEFQKDTGHKISASYGSTGKFFTQILRGAPFEVLLAADEEHPEKLLAAGLAQAQTDFVYAIGKLVLWSPKTDFVDAEGKVLQGKEFRHLSMAAPKLAPYGAAAEELLKNLKLWTKLEDKLIYGENISQTHQFVVSGNAELGFVSLSQVKDFKGSFWLPPQNLYKPLKQKAILLKGGKNKKVAEVFLTYLKSEKVQKILREFGYEVGP
ncbi:MAG: molybdate ABC transporter substrate-binding protein [Bdellovibrio sp.]|nr:molybdate ABC transporter substrate-binding protein [Bdellovibrio sp.]